MNVWKIKPLYYGKITGSKSLLTPGIDADVVADSPYLGFLLQDGKRNILVDTGIADEFIVDGKAWAGLPAEGGKAFVEESLAKNGISPPDIDTILFTHLHNDHASNLSLFEDANPTLIFQKDEWRILQDPLPSMMVRGDYKLDVIDEIKRMRCVMINGDMELFDGIKAFTTPGHTLGHQSFQVRTAEGNKVIVGDHFAVNYMAYGHMDSFTDMQGNVVKITPMPKVYGRFIPSTLIYNHYDFYDSSHKIIAHMEKDHPDFMIAGHEASLVLRDEL